MQFLRGNLTGKPFMPAGPFSPGSATRRPGAQALPAHAGGINPRRLAMILSTIRFGSIAVTKYRIEFGVI
jgi:hypothetical protein